ncbi:hypothetical protein Daus18300_011398 [Diaporthe australafricana]|uniref:Uncharacterized protein n=1 Tax=Diaporthe australafricana TaxID=127596 RepID=A0ABR3W6W7_9PEZI
MATVNMEWNKNAADALFSTLEVYPEDIVEFEDFCSTRTRSLSKIALLITSEGKRSMSSNEVALYTRQAVSELFTAINGFKGPYRFDRLLDVEIAISGFDEVPFRSLFDGFQDFPDAPDIGSFDIQYRHYINILRSLTAMPALKKLHLRQVKRSPADSQIALMSQDALYRAIAEAVLALSPMLEDLTLINMVDIQKFIDDCKATSWPNLRNLYLRGYINPQRKVRSKFELRRHHPQDGKVGTKVFQSFLDALPNMPKLRVVSLRMYNWDSMFIPGTGVPRFCFDMFLSKNPWPEYGYYENCPMEIPSSSGILYLQGIHAPDKRDNQAFYKKSSRLGVDPQRPKSGGVPDFDEQL